MATAKVLAIGGGGAGSGIWGLSAPGGGGGFQYEATHSITAGTYPVVVGAGGVKSNSSYGAKGTNGGNSTFDLSLIHI